jgi:hypothetical protein
MMFRSLETYSLQPYSDATPLHVIDDARSRTDALTAFRCDWRNYVVERLTQLCRLKRGWDGHGGRPLDGATAIFTGQVLASMMLPDVPRPSIMPLSYGGAQIEWHRRGWDVEIEVAAPNRVVVYTHEIACAVDKEFPLGANLSALREIVQKIKY